jgi:hypothetical protein
MAPSALTVSPKSSGAVWNSLPMEVADMTRLSAFSVIRKPPLPACPRDDRLVSQPAWCERWR